MLLASGSLKAAEPTPSDSAAARGYRFLTEKPYLPPDFDWETFDAAWKHWFEPPLASRAPETD